MFMQIPFPFESMLAFGSLAIMLLIGVWLRAKVSFFQRFLMPSCLIGGLLGLILLNIGLIKLPASSMETFAYHFFNISFISVGLTRDGDQNPVSRPPKGLLKGSLWMALIQSVTFPLQAIIGGLFIILLGIFGLKFFPTFGFFAPLGFNEGPGQALSFGKVWEGLGFEHAATIGATFATIGFFFAFFVGVPLVNAGIRRGLATHTHQNLSRDFLTGIMDRKQAPEPAGRLTLHSANIDTLAFHAALVGLVYVVTYAFVRALGSLFAPDVASMMWGFFFFFGLIFAFVTRWLMKKADADFLLDTGIQRRITGWSIDFLIVATVMAIQLQIVWNYAIPILAISMTCGVLTTVVVVFLGKRLWSYNLERTVAIYGTVTGTVSCGLLLLRIADPEFKTPAVIEVAVMNVIVLIPLAPYLVLVNAPVWWDWSIALTITVFLGAMVLSLILLKVLKLWQKPIKMNIED
jgi:ESS family glutamate:Na+ symporter